MPPCNVCSHTKLEDIRYPMEKVNRLFMEDFLKYKYDRPLVLVDEEPEERERQALNKELKAYATQIELRELINRKVIKLRCDLIYGPEKRDKSYKEPPLDFNIYEDPECHMFSI